MAPAEPLSVRLVAQESDLSAVQSEGPREPLLGPFVLEHMPLLLIRGVHRS